LAAATGALDATGVPHWLYGGWSEDFHAGAVQREHADIDLVVWSHDLDDATGALKSVAFAALDDTHFEREGVPLELCVVETDLAGNVLFVRDGVEWPAGALGGDRASLDGVTARVVNAEAARWRP
jgi:hypothetical protein